MLGGEPDLHHLVWVSVTDPSGSADSRIDALQITLESADGLGCAEAATEAVALVSTYGYFSQERHQFNWGATGLDVLTTTISYAVGVASGLTVEGIKEWIRHRPQTVSTSEVPQAQSIQNETAAWREYFEFIRRAFAEGDLLMPVSCDRDGLGGWKLVASTERASYEGEIYPEGRILMAHRQTLGGQG